MKKNLVSVRDRSGSCAVVLLVTPSKVYCANIGDSRAIASKNFGQVKESISTDHKPSEQGEKTRIIKAGGKVYQSNAINPNLQNAPPILGPFRVFPGRLSVSRTFGDCMAKMEKYGGNSKCIIADPDIFTVPIDNELDFILIGSDGIFDKISTEDTIQIVCNEAR